VHDFSLVHDDLEDRSDLRRHRKTVWRLWGDAQAINAGDGLFALSRLQIGRLRDQGVVQGRVLEAMRILDEACLALTEGQFLDLLFETEPQVSLDDYLWMIRGKTAALLACACQIGAAVATPDAATVRALHDFGYNLGMAFQIEDDILGAWGDPSVTGKPAADDLLHRKKTLPVVLTWEEGFAPGAPAAWRDAATLIRDLYASPSFGTAYVEKVLQALEAFDAKARCESLSQEYTLQAMDALSHAPLATESAEALRTVASTLLGRSR
jgi:geranylgeranyl diphosphate synthase type I